MTKAEFWEKARNRWYKLSMVLTEADCTISSVSLAMKAGFTSTDSMYKYFKTWGDRNIGACLLVRLSATAVRFSQ